MVGKIIYYLIIYPFIYLLSLLPFWAIYGLSHFFKFLIFDVIGYRKKVVETNLRNAFPEKSEKEIKQIANKFYLYFCDLILETIKTLTISKKKVLQHVTFENPEVVNKFYNKGQSVILVLGHYGNWELCGAASNYFFDSQFYAIYKPLHNKEFDNLLIKMRSRSGVRLIKMKETYKKIFSMVEKEELFTVAFIADQTPSPDNAYWTTFLNQDTPVFWGTENVARKTNLPVVYATLKRPKRGYYSVELEVIHTCPKESIIGEISEAHTRLLERDIKEQPEIWLWTHKRWKHKKPANVLNKPVFKNKNHI